MWRRHENLFLCSDSRVNSNFPIMSELLRVVNAAVNPWPQNLTNNTATHSCVEHPIHDKSGTWRFSVQLILGSVSSKKHRPFLITWAAMWRSLPTQWQMLSDQPFQLFIYRTTFHTPPFRMWSGDLGSQGDQGPSGLILLPWITMMVTMITFNYSNGLQINADWWWYNIIVIT